MTAATSPILAQDVTRHARLWRSVAVILLLLAPTAQAGTIDPSDDLLAPALGFSAPATQRAGHGLSIGCVSVDPAGTARAPSSFDRPVCALAAPAPQNRDFFRVAHADVTMTLGYVDNAQPGAGLMRLLASFSHFLSAGPLAGWQLRADAQVTRPPMMGPSSVLDERVKLFLGTKPAGGWSLHFDAVAATQGAISPGLAPDRSLEVAADVSRIFIVPGWGQDHSIDLRLSQGDVKDRVAGTDAQASKATLGYSHNTSFGTIGADVSLVRFGPGDSANHSETRSEIKFSRPF